MHAVAGDHAGADVALGRELLDRVRLERGQRLRIYREFLRERDVGAATGLDLVDAELVPADRLDEALLEDVERAIAKAEQQVVLVLEVDVEQRARQAGLARDLVHRHRADADLAGGGLGGVEDLDAAAFLFFLAALDQVVHGSEPRRALTRCQRLNASPVKRRTFEPQPARLQPEAEPQHPECRHSADNGADRASR